MRLLLPAACLALAAGCDTDRVLTVDPTTVVPAAQAITDAVSARAAAAGLFDALQSGSYYGETFFTFPDLVSDNALHSGTFSTYATADNLQLNAENTSIGGIWAAIYAGISRANAVIEGLADPAFVIDEDEATQYRGEAFLMRALGHHNATKFWGKVPLVTRSITNPADAGLVTRAEVPAVYTQILADLDSAEAYILDDGDSRRGTVTAVHAIRARVLFYQASTLTGAAQTAAYTRAIAEANVVMGARTLATNFADLFDPLGKSTSEDILRVRFSDQDAGSVSYYYVARSLGGRRELAPTNTAVSGTGAAADSTFAGTRRIYQTADARRNVTWGLDASNRAYVKKYPSVTGTEHIHVIRLAEVILIKAEAQARLGDLAGATATVNLIRARAGLAPQVLGVSQRYTTQAEVISFIIAERRRELAFEGDRYADLIRSGLITSFLTFMGASAEQAFYPVPQSERDVAPGLDQNAGY